MVTLILEFLDFRMWQSERQAPVFITATFLQVSLKHASPHEVFAYLVEAFFPSIDIEGQDAFQQHVKLDCMRLDCNECHDTMTRANAA